jgi:hypothetical protein
MRLLRSLFTLEINVGIPRIVIRMAGTGSFSLETLLASPRFNQGAVHRQMLVGQKPLCPGMTENPFKKGPGNVSFKKPVSILAENGCVPNRIVHAQTDKPAKQQVVIKLFHEEPLAAHGVRHLRQKRVLPIIEKRTFLNSRRW